MNFSNFLENMLTDSLWRGGALTSAGAAGSTAVVNKGIWAATTGYVVGDIVVPVSTFTAGGGKFLRCTTAGTSGSTTTLAVPNPGSTLSDGTVTWTAVAGMPCFLFVYAGLLVVNKGLRQNTTAYSLNDCISLTAQGGSGGDNKQHVYYCTTAGTTTSPQPQYNGVPGEAITDGTAVFTELSPTLDTGTGFPAGLSEVSGGSYARVKVNAGTYAALADWAGTQGSGTTTASTGTTGTTSNNNTITFPAPTANWATGAAQVGVAVLYDQLTSGNLLVHAPLTVPKTVNNGDAAPSFAAAAFTLQQDN